MNQVNFEKVLLMRAKDVAAKGNFVEITRHVGDNEKEIGKMNLTEMALITIMAREGKEIKKIFNGYDANSVKDFLSRIIRKRLEVDEETPAFLRADYKIVVLPGVSQEVVDVIIDSIRV